MPSHKLLIRAEVPRLVTNHPLLASHQQIEEVVDHDRHLDAINRGEHTPILRQPGLGSPRPGAIGREDRGWALARLASRFSRLEFLLFCALRWWSKWVGCSSAPGSWRSWR